MNRLEHKKMNQVRRANRVRAKAYGTADKPRLAVHLSNQHVTAQIINDELGKTLAYASSVGQKSAGALSQKAGLVGEDIAQKAKKAKVKKVVFDRHDKKYHTRLKTLAEAARKGGLEF